MTRRRFNPAHRGEMSHSFNSRHAVAYYASLGGYDGERPKIDMPTATLHMFEVARVLDVDLRDLVDAFDKARRADWLSRRPAEREPS